MTWTAGSGAVTAYHVLQSSTGAVLAAPAATAGSATIGGLPQGHGVSFVVEAVTTAGSYRSAASNTVYPYRQPPPQPPRPPCAGCKIP